MYEYYCFGWAPLLATTHNVNAHDTRGWGLDTCCAAVSGVVIKTQSKSLNDKLSLTTNICPLFSRILSTQFTGRSSKVKIQRSTSKDGKMLVVAWLSRPEFLNSSSASLL